VKLSSRVSVPSLVVLLLLVMTLDADTLVLRDGRRIQGQLISVENGVIEFQDSQSRSRGVRLDREEVLSIEFGRSERNEPQTQIGRPRGLRERQVMVVANAQWTDTSIDLRSGENVYFEASGEIRWGPNRRANPRGEQNSPNNAARPMPNRPGASLIGRIGNSTEFFFIGDDREAIRVRNSGRLFLGINDDNLQDNTGYFTVLVAH